MLDRFGGTIAGIAGLTDEGVCPALGHKGAVPLYNVPVRRRLFEQQRSAIAEAPAARMCLFS
jgi:hypothetical protein